MQQKALRALHTAAHAGIAEAQWLLAQYGGQSATALCGTGVPPEPATQHDTGIMLEWATRAAHSGVGDARRALADHAWATGNHADFIRWALPLARELLGRDPRTALGEQELGLLSRCADAVVATGEGDPNEALRLWERAAQAGERHAQFSLGLWYARMDSRGHRISGLAGTANYKKSIRWLSQSAEQGLPEAWYALSRIYLKPECSQRNLGDAQRYLELAAEAGHGPAQLELGMHEWRTRRDDESKDLRAALWLQKAAAQGGELGEQARQLLAKIAVSAKPASWAAEALRRSSREAASMYPSLMARLELAAWFGLSRSEALLLDPRAADCGHCLLVDIRSQHRHSKRRLVLIETGEQRQALDRIVRLFEYVDCGPDGPEGNYRQRLYRLKTLLQCQGGGAH
jgi:TPR repeat protein